MSMKKVEKRKEKREGLIMSKLNLEKERIRRRRRKQTKAEKTKRTPSLPRDPEKRRGERIKTRESM